MSISHKVITLSNTSNTLISDDENNLYYEVDITIQNIDDEAKVYIGTEGLTAESFGMILYPGSSIAISRILESDTIYARSDTNGTKIALFVSSSVKRKVYP